MEQLMSPEILLQALQASKPEDRLNVDTTSIKYDLRDGPLNYIFCDINILCQAEIYSR